MGLDAVEFLIATEKSFGLSIPDRDCDSLTTPRKLIDYLHSQLPTATRPVCISQRIFHRLRTSFGQRGLERRQIRRQTNLWDSLDVEDRRQNWIALGAELGVVASWPVPAKPSWWIGTNPRNLTAEKIVRILTAYQPRAFLSEEELWTRPQITAVIHALISWDLGVDTKSKHYNDDLTFRGDMGID